MILATHEDSRECVWLRSLVHHIRETCVNKVRPTVLFKDNETYITQIREGYIKDDMTKYIDSKFFFTHEIRQRGEIDVYQIRSCDNPVDLFTNALLTSPFEKLVHKIGMRKLRDL